MFKERFVIDSNVFINSKNFYYNFGYCKIFWDLLLELHKKGLVYSINSVKNELKNGNDEIVDWINNEVPSSFLFLNFHPLHGAIITQHLWNGLSQPHVNSQTKQKWTLLMRVKLMHFSLQKP